MDPSDLINLLPSGPTREKITTAIVLIMLAGRILKAVRNEGGFRGAASAVIQGTNTPKPKE